MAHSAGTAEKNAADLAATQTKGEIYVSSQLTFFLFLHQDKQLTLLILPSCF